MSNNLRMAVLCLLAAVGGCSAEGAEEGKIVLTYTRWGQPAEMESTKELIRHFMDENPNIVVRIDVVSWEQYWQKMATAATTKTAQDVWLMSAAYVEQYASAGHLVDLMQFINKDPTFNLDDYFPHPFDDYCFRKVATGGVDKKGEKITELRHAKFGEKGAMCFSFTRDYNCSLLYYNRDHFDALGLKYPDESWTWDDLVKAAKKLTIDRDGDGIIDQWGYYGLSYSHFARTDGGHLMDVAKRKSTYSSPEVVKAITFCRDLIHRYKVHPPPDIQIEGDAFTTGKASMTLSGVWNIRRFNRSKYLWDVTAIPVDRKGRKRISSGGGVAHCIYSGTQNPLAAWKLVKFLSSEKSQRELAKSGTSVPVLKSAAHSDDFLAPFDRPARKSHKLIFRCLTGKQRVPTFTRGYLTYSEYARDITRGVWMGVRTPEKACRMIDEFTDKVLAKEYGLRPADEEPPSRKGEGTKP